MMLVSLLPLLGTGRHEVREEHQEGEECEAEWVLEAGEHQSALSFSNQAVDSVVESRETMVDDIGWRMIAGVTVRH